MSPSNPVPFVMLPLSSQKRITDFCARFESEWKTNGRPDVSIWYQLADQEGFSTQERTALLGRLLLLDLDYRSKSGETPSIADYEGRFPDQPSVLQSVMRSVPPGSGYPTAAQPAVGPDLFLGPVLPPDFETVRELGRGGMGVV